MMKRGKELVSRDSPSVLIQVLKPTMLDEFERKPEDGIRRVHDVCRRFRHISRQAVHIADTGFVSWSYSISSSALLISRL
jgi:hypothetical protein